jgi:hypothetical protein
MAVKPEIIKARLKVLFPKANLSQKRLDTYVAKLAQKPADDADEEAIDAIINDYNDVIDFTAMAQEDDRVRTTEAEKKKAAELAAKAKGGSDQDDDDDDDDDDDKDMTPFEKRMLKNFGALKLDIDSIKSGNVQKSKLEQAKALLGNSEVFKKLDEDTKSFMLKNVDLDSETTFEDQITGLEGMFGKMVQKSADENQYAPGAGQGNPSKDVDDKLVGDIVEKM